MTKKRTAAGGIRPGTARKICGPALAAALAGSWALTGATWAADQGSDNDNTAHAQPASDLA